MLSGRKTVDCCGICRMQKMFRSRLRLSLAKGRSNMSGISSAVWLTDVDEPRRLVTKTHTHTRSIHADIGNPQIRHTCLLVLTLAGVQNHIQTFITMQLVCCSGTTSAVRAILSSPPSVRSPFPDFPFLLPSPLFLFIPLTLQKPPQTLPVLFSVSLSFSPPPPPPFLPSRSRWCRRVLSSIWLSGLTLWEEW